ncbi:hypothetical protein GOBAR_AA12847 [Gossypium barbadense]|uniref:Uncharacterized protein n=1 Tax=Gossypium barbadense TaxID=3634 RepID=A0A2P5XWT8_GOSBA|nr:hypothetical protein GOBAR_AA12847 [Gossypium barbadense]
MACMAWNCGQSSSSFGSSRPCCYGWLEWTSLGDIMHKISACGTSLSSWQSNDPNGSKGTCLPEFDKKDLLYAIGVKFEGIIRFEINGDLCQLRINLDVQKPL